MADETSNSQLKPAAGSGKVAIERSGNMDGIRQFYVRLMRQIETGQPFAVATVVKVVGSSSAKSGSKAIISNEGRNLFGWVGGGCAESFVIQNAIETIESGASRLINVDLNDEVFGVGMPCGGNIDVFIEPVLPAKRLLIAGTDTTATLLVKWAEKLGFEVHLEGSNEIDETSADCVVLRPGAECRDAMKLDCEGLISTGLPINPRSKAEEAISLTAKLIVRQTSGSGSPLSCIKSIEGESQAFHCRKADQPKLVLIGHNRITENIAELAVSLGWAVSVNSLKADQGAYPSPVCRVLNDDAYEMDEVTPGSYVVIATQHKGDHLALRNILTRQTDYIGLIASRTRSTLVMDALQSEGILDQARGRLRAPCGLDLGAHTPFEIAVSIVCEIIANRNNSVN